MPRKGKGVRRIIKEEKRYYEKKKQSRKMNKLGFLEYEELDDYDLDME
ncbi:hypothetical protein [Candidatus Hodarchaeum mangrovi]